MIQPDPARPSESGTSSGVPPAVGAVTVLGVRFRRPMTGRDVTEEHRGTSPLELLFDLSFVVAVSGAAAGLAGALAAGDAGPGLLRYLMVFFAIWWAWMNFTWFASAYDTDDVLYRLLAMVQMAGSLVLAAGVPAAFAHDDYLVVTLGYLVMRLGLIALWLRSAIESPQRRRTSLLFAGGLTLVQALWLARLALPHTAGLIAFFVLMVAELVVPVVAETVGGHTPWHPEHIVDRYGAFTVIVLGEVILAASESIAHATGTGVTRNLLLLAGGALLLVFALWWLYFKSSMAESLRRRSIGPFVWGYVHYLLFAGIAAVGAGVEALAEIGDRAGAPSRPADLMVTGAAAVVLVALGALRRPQSGRAGLVRSVLGAVVLVAIGAVGWPGGLTALVAGVVCAAVLAWHLVDAWLAERSRPAGTAQPAGYDEVDNAR